MTQEELQKKFSDLEFRYAHQESALEDMHKLVLRQEKELERLQIQMRELMRRLQEVEPSNIATQGEEAPPPHY